MPKLYYPTPDELQGAVPLNENLWMREYQGLMLALANTSEGKDLLCIEDYGLPIIGIRKNAVLYDQGDKWMADFRVGAKWGNVVRYRWQEVKRALNRMNELALLKAIRAGVPAGAATLGPIYPDPHPETTTVDGLVGRMTAGTWAEIRDGDGNTIDDTGDFVYTTVGSSGGLGSTFGRLRRGSFGFDTSPIGGGTVSSATFSLCFSSTEASLTGGTGLTHALVLSSPASDTALVASDYQNGFGTTRLADDIAGGSITADSSTYNDQALIAAGLAAIDGTGVTHIGARIGQDVSNAPPTGGNGDNAAYSLAAENTGTSKDPKLVVVYTPAPFKPRLIMF